MIALPAGNLRARLPPREPQWQPDLGVVGVDRWRDPEILSVDAADRSQEGDTEDDREDQGHGEVRLAIRRRRHELSIVGDGQLLARCGQVPLGAVATGELADVTPGRQRVEQDGGDEAGDGDLDGAVFALTGVGQQALLLRWPDRVDVATAQCSGLPAGEVRVR